MKWQYCCCSWMETRDIVWTKATKISSMQTPANPITEDVIDEDHPRIQHRWKMQVQHCLCLGAWRGVEMNPSRLNWCCSKRNQRKTKNYFLTVFAISILSYTAENGDDDFKLISHIPHWQIRQLPQDALCHCYWWRSIQHPHKSYLLISTNRAGLSGTKSDHTYETNVKPHKTKSLPIPLTVFYPLYLFPYPECAAIIRKTFLISFRRNNKGAYIDTGRIDSNTADRGISPREREVLLGKM